jgi:FixJ family two-component response regulator
MPRVVHVVDDDASFQTATGYLLKQAGYEVASYPSAEHFLDHLPNESVRGCILLKVRMPGLSGPDLQERLSDLGSALPIIFLTRYLDIPTTVRTIKAGALDFLIKPVSSDQLLQAVERAIARHDAMRSLKGTLNAVRSRIATLTPREREVFELVIRGQTNKQIMDSAKHCRDQAEECLRLVKSTQSEAQARVLRNISYSWSRLAGQIDRYNELVREQGSIARK